MLILLVLATSTYFSKKSSNVIISIVPNFFAVSTFVELLKLSPIIKMFVVFFTLVSMIGPNLASNFSNSFFVYFDVLSKSENTIILFFKAWSFASFASSVFASVSSFASSLVFVCVVCVVCV